MIERKKVRVIGEWIMEYDVDNVDVEYDYKHELREVAVNMVVDEIEERVSHAKWTVDIVEEDES